MKKLIFLLLLIPINVFAVNYSPFSEYKYTDNYVKGNDLCEVEEVKKYKYYSLEKDYELGYHNLNYKDDYYIYHDSDYIYSDVITSNDIPDLDEVINLEENTYTYYQEYNKIRYVILNNFTYSNYLKINEITIFDKSNKTLNYEIISGPSSIHDFNTSTSDRVYNDDVIILKLPQEYKPSDIMLMNIYVAGKLNSKFSLDYNFNYTGNPDDLYYHGNLSGGLSSINSYNIFFKDIIPNESLNGEIKKINGYYESINNAKIIKYDTNYTYQEKLYKFYNYKKVYLDDYYLEKPDGNYIKDDTDYKTVYRYRCRSILKNVVDSAKIAYKQFFNKNKNDTDNIVDLNLINNSSSVNNNDNNNKNNLLANTTFNKTYKDITTANNEKIEVLSTDNENKRFCAFQLNNIAQDNEKIETKKQDNSNIYIKIIIVFITILTLIILLRRKLAK